LFLPFRAKFTSSIPSISLGSRSLVSYFARARLVMFSPCPLDSCTAVDGLASESSKLQRANRRGAKLATPKYICRLLDMPQPRCRPYSSCCGSQGMALSMCSPYPENKNMTHTFHPTADWTLDECQTKANVFSPMDVATQGSYSTPKPTTQCLAERLDTAAKWRHLNLIALLCH